MRIRTLRSGGLVLAVGLALAACTSTEPAEPAAQPDPVEQSGPLADQLAFAIAAFNQSVDADAYESRYATSFRNDVPLEAFDGIYDELALRGQAPWELVRFLEGPTATDAVALIRSAHGEQWSITITIEADAPHHVVAQWIAPHTDPTSAPVEGPFPPTPVGEQLDWVVQAINAPADNDDYLDHVSPEFATAVPLEAFEEVAVSMRATGPVRFERIIESKAFEAKAWIFDANDTRTTISIAVDEAEPHVITMLLAEPVALADPPGSLDDFVEAVSDLAPMSSVVVARVTADGCNPLAEHEADRSLAIGSSFKLVVLQALEEAIAAGDLAWDDLVPIRDELKSLPSGVTQDDPAGTELTIRELAERMISISDNTATDHLLHLVGREAVEAAQSRLGISDPTRNLPFLSTRELFQLKWQLDESDRLTYRQAETQERRSILDGLAEQELSIEPRDVAPDVPVAIEDLEWFLSANDLCRTLVDLVGAAGGSPDPETARILGINPGIRLDPDAWPVTAFKGGSEPGVLSLPVLARRSDGAWFFVSATVNDPESAPPDWGQLPLLVAAAFDLLAEASP